MDSEKNKKNNELDYVAGSSSLKTLQLNHDRLFEYAAADKEEVFLNLIKFSEKIGELEFVSAIYTALLSDPAIKAKPMWYFRHAENYRRRAQWELAVKNYLMTSYKVPKPYKVDFGIAKCFVSLGAYDKASVYISNCHEIVDSAFLELKAKIFFKLNKWQLAAAAYQQAIDNAGDFPKTMFFIRQAVCYKNLHKYQDAVDNYLKVISDNQDNASFYAALAWCYVKLGNHQDAIYYYSKATDLDGTRVEWFAELGRLLVDIDKKAAVEAYQRAVQLGRSALSYEVAVLSSDANCLQHVSPEVLFTAKRFDLCVKYLYARFLIDLNNSNSSIDPVGLYFRHIHLRTKGKEPDNLEKVSLNDYQISFAKLLESIKQHGFDDNHAIPLAQDTCLLNGAHRVAAAKALRLDEVPVVFTDRLKGIGWDFDWFAQRAFNLEELNELLLCWLENTPERGHIFILWPAVIEHWDSITKDIANDLELITQREINCTALGFSELVKDIYSTDAVADFMPNIIAKLETLSAYQPKLRVLVVYGDTLRVRAVKEKIRQQYAAIMPEHLFCTLHASSDYKEAMHLGHIFFHQATLELLKNRASPLSETICYWIAEAKKALLNRNVSVLNGCVVGGAVLDAYGIRNADDLDMTVTHTVRQAHFSDKASPLTDAIDIVNKDYAKSVSGVISDDILLTDRALHIYVRGFKFASLDVVRQRKSYSQREKDMADLSKISCYYLANKDG